VPTVPNSPSPFTAYTKQVTRIEVVDPYTIRFHTAAPYPLMPSDLTQIAIRNKGTFPALVNMEMVDVEGLDDADRAAVHDLLERHHELTGSVVAGHILEAWTLEASSFRKVMPRDYRRVLEEIRTAEAEGLGEEATLERVMAASRG
jgi:hypothetical protein